MAQTPVGTRLLKWLVAPIAMGALGFYVVGPQVGGSVAAKVRAVAPEQAKALKPVADSLKRAVGGTSAPGPSPSTRETPSEPTPSGNERRFAPPEVVEVEGHAVSPRESGRRDSSRREPRRREDGRDAPPDRSPRRDGVGDTTVDEGSVGGTTG